MREIIFATTNKGKLKEIREILQPLGIVIQSLSDIEYKGNIVENGTTFEENAIIKATQICKETGKIVLADDSGLEIDYLDKAPGVLSARFMGENTEYEIKNNAIINKLEGVPEEQRTARFACAIAAAFPDGTVKTTYGTIEGIIGYKIEGENGFGYDPIFFVPELGVTTAQLSSERKNEISHRGKALRAMLEVLKDKL